MIASTRRYTITVGGSVSDLAEIAENYPLKQTQALVLSIEETLGWLALARSMFGTPAPECLGAYSDWLGQVEETLESLVDEIDGDDDLALCRQSADDPWYDSVDELLESFAEIEIEAGADDGGEYGELCIVLARMAHFWLEQLRYRVAAVLKMMSGDGEVLAILAHYKQHGSFVIS